MSKPDSLKPDASSTPFSGESSRDWAELARLLNHSQRSLQRLIADLGPSESEWVLLWVCHEAPPEGTAQVQFAEALGISAAQVSSLVERLREQGLLDATRCPNDRRRRLWRLTPSGRETLESAGRTLCERLGKFSQQPSVELLTAIRERLSEFVATLNGASATEGRAA